MKNGLFFLDSGAFSLYRLHASPTKYSADYTWFYSQDFMDYVDAYAKFIQKYKDVINYYANVDVMYNPERTWAVQRHLESRGLKPVPTVHFSTDIKKWVKHYIDAGYDFIGIGGYAMRGTVDSHREWTDELFEFVCPPPSRLPIVKLHGFAMTSYELMRRYPWFSVDSASWTKSGAYGNILVPHKRNGAFTFDVDPYTLPVSEDSPQKQEKGKHYRTLSVNEKAIIKEWLRKIDVPLGLDEKEKPLFDGSGEQIHGVATRHSERKIANLIFFERLRASLPEYPWPYQPRNTIKGSFFK